MALDRSLTLLRGLPGETPERTVHRVAHELASVSVFESAGESRQGVTLPRVWSDGRGTDLRLYVPTLQPARISHVINELRTGHRNPYEILSDDGILVISSIRPREGGVALSGGSYCDVVLQARGDHSVVVKTVTRNGAAGSVDGLRRHRNEAEWLASATSCTHFFPQLELILDHPDAYAFETRFFPAYSLAELVFQLRMTGSRLAEVLIWLYEQLRSTLYSHEPIRSNWRDPDQNYVQKVRRRSQLLLDSARGTPTPLTALVGASRVRVNGRLCPSLAGLLRAVESDPLWRPIVRPKGTHACHGDLILEDILLKPGPKQEIKLVDPNPYNQHGLLDLAKTMLSLWIGYEFIYFDFFRVEIEADTSRDEVSIHVSLDLNDRGERYALAAAHFMDYARSEISDALGLPRDSFHRLIRMAAALTALAIPAFHVIRHHRPDRALAFFALGLLHASHALADTSPPFCP